MKKHHKKSIGKRILKGFFYLILLCVAVIVAAYLFAGQIVKKAVTTIVPPITQTSVTLDNVDLSLLSGHVNIHGLSLGNPKGFSDNNIFELGDITVDFDPKSVLTDTMMIHTIQITGTGIAAEMNAKGETNVGVLNQNIQSYLGTTDKGDKPTAQSTQPTTKTDTDAGKKVIIRDLTINDTHVTLGLAGKTVTLTLPTIHQTDIGAKKDRTPAEIVANILSLFSSESVKAVLNAGEELAKQGLSQAKDLLNAGKAGFKQQADEAKKALDGLKGLFR